MSLVCTGEEAFSSAQALRPSGVTFVCAASSSIKLAVVTCSTHAHRAASGGVFEYVFVLSPYWPARLIVRVLNLPVIYW